jgi:hypothetical protein
VSLAAKADDARRIFLRANAETGLDVHRFICAPNWLVQYCLVGRRLGNQIQRNQSEYGDTNPRQGLAGARLYVLSLLLS